MAMNGIDFLGNSLFGEDSTTSDSQDINEAIKTSMDEGTSNLTTSLGITFDEAAIKIANAIIAGINGNPSGGVSSGVDIPAPDTGKTDTAANNMSEAMTSAGASAAASMGSAITNAALTGSGDFSAALNSVFASAISSLISAMTSSAMSSVAGSAAGAAFASGGPIRGPGTGTSDSIPIWASNGEFMMREASVRHYGVDFFHALNQGRIPKFSSGGLVSNVTAPSAPNMNYAANSQPGGTTLAPVIQQTLVVDGGEMFTAGINSVQGKKETLTFIQVNRQTIRQSLGID